MQTHSANWRSNESNERGKEKRDAATIISTVCTDTHNGAHDSWIFMATWSLSFDQIPCTISIVRCYKSVSLLMHSFVVIMQSQVLFGLVVRCWLMDDTPLEIFESYNNWIFTCVENSWCSSVTPINLSTYNQRVRIFMLFVTVQCHGFFPLFFIF